MNPGKMNVRMIVLSPVQLKDASGGAYVEWYSEGTIYAARESVKQNLDTVAGMQATTGEQEFISRFVSYLTTACRVMLDEKQFRVVAVSAVTGTPVRNFLIRFTLKEGEAA